MTEFNGWISIVEDDSDDADIDELNRRREQLCDYIEECSKSVFGLNSNRRFHLHRALNANAMAVFCGCNNHRDESVIEWFKLIANNQPCSYGKMHIRDDEDGRGFQNSLQAWTMARGTVFEETDSSMSPCIPIIEDEDQT